MRVGVIGGGQMGAGIAEVCARSGVDVTVVEANDERAERSRASIEKSLDRGVRSGKLSEDEKSAALDHLAVTATFEDLEGADAAFGAIVDGYLKASAHAERAYETERAKHESNSRMVRLADFVAGRRAQPTER